MCLVQTILITLSVSTHTFWQTSWLHRASTISSTLFSNWCTQR